MNPWEKGVWYITIGLTAALLAKLWWTDLYRIYKLFFCYLAADFLASIGGIAIPFRSKAYGDFYFSAQTIKILIAAFMLVEIYSLALERYPALARFFGSAVGYILAVSGAVPLIALWVNHSASTAAHPYLRTFFLFERTMDGTMGIFLILISIFMAWFPVRLRRNVIVYISGFIVWSLSRSLLAHVVSQWFAHKPVKLAADVAQMAIGVSCLLFWLIGLRREGELRTAVVGHLWNRAEAERLTEQLDAVNAGLARLRRKQSQDK